MNRLQLRQLAEDRILDAAALLAAGRWSGAYYMAGYAVECGLKACIMVHVETTGVIFQDKKFTEKCWTHDLKTLVYLANLEQALNSDMAASAVLAGNWGDAEIWDEVSRYQQKTELDARTLYDAIATVPDGVLPWIRLHW